MPQERRRSKPEDDAEVLRLYTEIKSLRKVAAHLGVPLATVQRAVKRAREATQQTPMNGGTPHHTEHAPTDHPIASIRRNVEEHPVDPDREAESIALAPRLNSDEDAAPTTALQTVEPIGAPDPSQVHTLAQPYAQLLARVEALESHQAVVDAYLATWQAMHKAAQPMHTSAVQAMHTDVHTWENPDDAKPERWNLLLPRGLKREIDAQAKAAGIPASTLVTRLLIAAVHIHAQAMHTAEGVSHG